MNEGTPVRLPPGRMSSFPTPKVLQHCVVEDVERPIASPTHGHQTNHDIDPVRVRFEGGLELTTTGVLGVGGFGKVYAASTPSGERFALKVSAKPLRAGDLRRLKDEVKVMHALSNHPNVVHIHSAALRENYAYIAMERCCDQSLHQLATAKPLTAEEFKWIGYQLVRTVTHMHEHGMIHRDIKPQNLLFDSEGNLKVTDFGLSSRLSDDAPRKTVAGTQLFMAPEMASHLLKVQEAQRLGREGPARPAGPGLSYGAEVDVWSIGIALFIIATRVSPYSHRKNDVPPDAWTRHIVHVVAEGDVRWPDGATTDPDIRGVIELALRRDPDHPRPTMADLLRHPVWYQRPSSAPLTLLRRLSLVESTRRSDRNLQPLPANTATIRGSTGKRSLLDVLDSSLRLLQVAEDNGRLELETMATAWFDAAEVSEAIQREALFAVQQLRAEESRERTRALMSFKASLKTARRKAESRIRAESIAIVPQEAKGSLRRAPDSPLSADGGRIVNTTRSSVEVHYEDRATSTRYGLRSTITVPVEPRVDRCLNHHLLRTIAALPPGYDAFDCDVCGQSFSELSYQRPILRCYKCDYDVCWKCAETPESNRQLAKHFCSVCNKRFMTATKLRQHAKDCKGPSASPLRESVGGRMSSPRRGESTRRTSSRSSARGPSTGRRSTHGRVSAGSSFAEQSWHDSPDSSRRLSFANIRPSARLADEVDVGRPSVYEGPPEFEPPTRRRAQSSAPRDAKAASPMRKSAQRPPATPPAGTKRSGAASPLAVGGPAGANKGRRGVSPTIAAPPPAGPNKGGPTQISIAQNLAERPAEVGKRPRTAPKSASRGRGISTTTATEERPVATHGTEQDLAATAIVPSRASTLHEPPSTKGHATRPLMPPPPLVQPARSQPRTPSALAREATPVVGPNSTRSLPSVYPPPQPAPANPPRRSSNAFLALPRDPAARQEFVDGFLSAAWVRSFAFAHGDVAVMYYCLQPGRCGCLYCPPGEAGTLGTMVLDVHTRMVLHVPELKSELAERQKPHPHVATAYPDPLKLMSMADARAELPSLLDGIVRYLKAASERRRRDEAPDFISAPYLHDPQSDRVPHETPFAYIRKVFPDPDGCFTLFRLSNLNTQVINLNDPNQDIRWRSDPRGTNRPKGSQYYVKADGTVTPFTNDPTGILTKVENALVTVFGG